MVCIKYAVLDDFRTFLQGRYASRATVKQYYFWAARLLEGQFFTNPAGVDMAAMAEGLESKTKNRNEYSQAKNAFLNFSKFLSTKVEIPVLNKTQKRGYRKLKARNLKDMNRKINIISDKKLMLSYKIMLATGLRVGELASIEKRGIQPFENGGFSLAFTPKRGGTDTIVILADNKYICKGIAEVIQPDNSIDKAFYSVGYLQENAKRRGFACHDLRRAFAKTTYKDSGGNLTYTTEKMRHASPRTTKIYLRSKVEV